MQRVGFEPACTKDGLLARRHNHLAMSVYSVTVVALTCFNSMRRKWRLWVNKEGSRWTCGTVIQCHTS